MIITLWIFSTQNISYNCLTEILVYINLYKTIFKEKIECALPSLFKKSQNPCWSHDSECKEGPIRAVDLKTHTEKTPEIQSEKLKKDNKV